METLAICYESAEYKDKSYVTSLICAVLKNFKDSEQEKIPGAKDGVEVYKYLLKLSKVERTVPLLTPPEISGENYPFTQVLKACFEYLKSNNDKSEWSICIDNTKDKLKELPESPEKRIALALTEEWSNLVPGMFFETPQLELQLAPFLGYDEESEQDDKMLPLLLWNHGGTAHGIELIQSEGGNTDKADLISKLAPDSGKEDGDNLTKSAARFICLPVDQQTTTLSLTVSCRNCEQQQRDPSLSIKLSKPDRDKDSDKWPSNLRNPYIPDRVLGPENAFVGRQELLTEMESMFKDESSRGEIICLWGMRHVGKTSLLYRLQQLMEPEKPLQDVIPLYVNCAIFDRDHSWSHEEFVSFLFLAIQDKLLEHKLLGQEIIQHSPDQPGSISETKFFKSVGSSLKNKKIAIFFDDADIFSQRLIKVPNQSDGSDKESLLFPNFPARTWKMFERLIAEAQQSRGLKIYFVFATENAIGTLWNGDVQPPARESQRPRLALLSREELKKLTEFHDMTPRYDDLAFEYLWRVTGGHPAIAQLICYHVMSYCKRTSFSPANKINLALIRQVVKEIVNSGNLVGYFSYIWQYSLSEKLLDLLERLILSKEEHIDQRTLIIKSNDLKMPTGSEFGMDSELSVQGAMERLVDIGFVSKTEGQYILRLGMFYLWTKVWRQLSEDQGQGEDDNGGK